MVTCYVDYNQTKLRPQSTSIIIFKNKKTIQVGTSGSKLRKKLWEYKIRQIKSISKKSTLTKEEYHLTSKNLYF